MKKKNEEFQTPKFKEESPLERAERNDSSEFVEFQMSEEKGQFYLSDKS